MSAPWRGLLPTSVEVCGTEYEIRSDYRAALDICAALSDPDLDEGEKAFVALDVFYPALESMPPEHYREGMRQCFRFINCGEEEQGRPLPKLMDWEQDFKYVVAPINRVMGREIREAEYLHWWTFVAAYYEIGDCLFAQIVRIRDLKARGKPLDKADREWYRNNRHLVDLKMRYTEQEESVLKQWGGG